MIERFINWLSERYGDFEPHETESYLDHLDLSRRH